MTQNATDGIPIVIFHKGNQLYVKCVLEHTARTNPDSPIYLLTDSSFSERGMSRTLLRHIRRVNITDFSSLTEEFTAAYVHLSPNSYDFELTCFLRWFIILDFIRKNDITSFFHIDSDTLVYSNLTDIAQTRLHGKSISVTHGNCPNSTFFTRAALEDFCAFTLGQYKDGPSLEALKALYLEKQKYGGGYAT